MKKLFPAFIGAGVCLFFIRGGALTIFFLVPLGFLAFKYPYRIAWSGVLFAVLGNVVMALQTAAAHGIPAEQTIWNVLYFSMITSIFVLIYAPPPFLKTRVPGLVRFITGCCLGAVLFIGVFYRIMVSPGFSVYVNSVLDNLVSRYFISPSDVVQNALMESITGDSIVELMKSLVLRGGGLASITLMFFISRQISLFLYRVSSMRARRTRALNVSTLTAFHVSPRLIWVLSFSLLFVVLTRIIKLEVPEIILWNILVLCIILYFAQGSGILQFFLTKPSIPFFLRFLLTVLLFILIFSPVINAVLLSGIILLGIAENWAPFRAPKQNGPPSTPEEGDGGN